MQAVGAAAPRANKINRDGPAPWAQDADASIYQPVANGYGAGVRGAVVPAPTVARCSADAVSAFDRPTNGYGAGLEAGGRLAHRDAHLEARAIRAKMAGGGGNVLSWS